MQNTKPRIRCRAATLFPDSLVTFVNPTTKQHYSCTWQDAKQMAFNGNDAAKYPNLTGAIRGAIQLA